jgi:hypothetical protein
MSESHFYVLLLDLVFGNFDHFVYRSFNPDFFVFEPEVAFGNIVHRLEILYSEKHLVYLVIRFFSDWLSLEVHVLI